MIWLDLVRFGSIWSAFFLFLDDLAWFSLTWIDLARYGWRKEERRGEWERESGGKGERRQEIFLVYSVYLYMLSYACIYRSIL